MLSDCPCRKAPPFGIAAEEGALLFRSLREPLPPQGHQRPHDPHDTQKDRGHPLLSFAHAFSLLSFRSQAAPPKARSGDGSKII